MQQKKNKFAQNLYKTVVIIQNRAGVCPLKHANFLNFVGGKKSRKQN